MAKSKDKTPTITEKDLKRYMELNKQKKEIEAEMKHLKKQFNDVLDGLIGKGQKGEFERGGLKVQRQVREAISYDKSSTVEKLEELNLEDCIQVIKQPDAEKLEAAFRLGLADENVFAELRKTKVTQAIIVKES
ncbi:hypothetical protein ACFO3D_08735 [Virgibacillus kekensis]|uniref:Uncharacterized protein n=1 Tax=Virgibacillus kekensis TaxID=202261 RepID=A0ABV9DL31_9BACI